MVVQNGDFNPIKSQSVKNHQLSNEQKSSWLFDIGDEILPNYMGILWIIISQCKDP